MAATSSQGGTSNLKQEELAQLDHLEGKVILLHADAI